MQVFFLIMIQYEIFEKNFLKIVNTPTDIWIRNSLV